MEAQRAVIDVRDPLTWVSNAYSGNQGSSGAFRCRREAWGDRLVLGDKLARF